ncbi:hypothetical protein [Carnobacterium maltaromaticum]|uniref:hypothetical protein n=1 Tax=Carnobacterium maltaromaticum TaxID=2751 RepID=UPI0012FA7386|nr:hypothetical protein [Carnobacterium maltaromaticum]
MGSKGTQFLAEIKQMLHSIDENYPTHILDDPEHFIACFKKQEQTIEEISLMLTNFRNSHELMDIKEQKLVGELKKIMKEQEEMRLVFHDWGNPLAIFSQQQAILKEIKTTLSFET